ncbi:MAG: LysM peptidoglycan-binding domain-containing protein [Desulfuromonadaceae bacterium]|nr:LysM peptidoglycan-binding domain-containing protein [Desulfuromonadaceae bacterium]MDD5104115.1 LysM peptidoglycan-binding domain-containing protein [Desulfuromonadaceae bacterium]
MTASDRLSLASAVLLLCLAPPAMGEQFIYIPQTVVPGEKASAQDGILVQEVHVKKGDSLYRISRKFSGHGMYFSQILLFNSIKNPNLIYPGNIFRVPVRHSASNDYERISAAPPVAAQSGAVAGEQTTATEVTAIPVASEQKSAGAAVRGHKKKVTKRAAKKARKSSPAAQAVRHADAVMPASQATGPGQQLYESAMKAYRQDDCHTALDLLDRFLAENPGSPRAADASLYKGDCYLKLSTQ